MSCIMIWVSVEHWDYEAEVPRYRPKVQSNLRSTP